MTQSFVRHRKTLMKITTVLTAVATLGLAPLLIQALSPTRTDWQRLSDISQIYGSLVSAIALVGVAVSLAYQAHQATTLQEETQRASHRQLVTMALNDPDLMVCWEPMSAEVTLLEAKQIGFVNLIISNWSADYRLKRFNEAQLRRRLEVHFRGEMARKHWQVGGAGWRLSAEAAGESRLLRFVSLIEESYEQAVAAGPPHPSSAYFRNSA
ncbi:DUF6082 family protein [Streptomyces apricus]|uniref:Uncharacterized protein n=1 Tax=Streptomyces apricus TaxID=1828112 RepID=A0A5B0AKU0_9ACTN|nr:DUF6082 family protein [Streptomyces apricus]KAA0930444.1 hypothetical protein FGF04_28100 [Streptomyces apricus]